MKKHLEYIENVEKIIKKVSSQPENIEKASNLISDALINDKSVFLLGTGHSHMLCEELFYRAGGLVKIQPILIDALMLHVSASQSTILEREEGLAEKLYYEYSINPGDTIIIISNSGRNGVVIDMALLCRERGVNVIALTNLEHTFSGESRHKCGKRLCEIADIVLDNGGCTGDACIEIDGISGKICPTSTVLGAMILNSVIAGAVELCANKGFYPDHFASSNIDGGDEINNALIEKYKNKIKHL